MDSRLFMEIGMENSTFKAVDQSPYERWINDGDLDGNKAHLVLQRIISVKDDNPTIISTSSEIAETPNELRSSFEVENLANGLYYYQKLLLPTADHTTDSNIVLWYDADELKVNYYNSSSDETITYDIWEDFDDIFSIVRRNYPDNCFYFDDYSFTIYYLVECFVMLEREIINNYLKNNCRDFCETNSELTAKADILLAAIMVINHLIEKEEFFEAQRILNGLSTCGNLCENYTTNISNGCGCGES